MNRLVQTGGKWHEITNILLLAVGTAMLFATHLKFGIEIFAWILYVPYILYLHRTRGFSSIAVFALALFIGWTLAIFKIITDPLPWYFAFIYSFPITLLHLAGFLAFRMFRNNQHWWLIGVSAFTVAEWLLGAVTPFGTWGAVAYAKLNDLALLQMGSLFGISCCIAGWAHSRLAQ